MKKANLLVIALLILTAVIWGWLLLGEYYSPANLAGCGLIFAAVLMVQLPSFSPEQGDLQKPR